MRTPLLLALVASVSVAAERPRLAVLLVIDQLGATTFDNRAPSTAYGIKRMLAEGLKVGQLRYQTAPTVTSEGHATLVTGCWPETHGITSNEWFDEGLQRPVYSTEDPKYQTLGREPRKRDCTSPQFLRAPTLGDTLKAWKADAKVVAISGKERSAILPGGVAADAVVWIDIERGMFTTSTYYAKEVPAFVDGAIVARPYWLYGVKENGAHGTPWLYDRAVPLVLFGGGVKRGELETADAVDVAPTLAALIGAPPPAASVGHVIPTR